MDRRGVTGRGVAAFGVSTCRQGARGVPARVFKMCPQASVEMRTPTGDGPVRAFVRVPFGTVDVN